MAFKDTCIGKYDSREDLFGGFFGDTVFSTAWTRTFDPAICETPDEVCHVYLTLP